MEDSIFVTYMKSIWIFIFCKYKKKSIIIIIKWFSIFIDTKELYIYYIKIEYWRYWIFFFMTKLVKQYYNINILFYLIF